MGKERRKKREYLIKKKTALYTHMTFPNNKIEKKTTTEAKKKTH